MRNTDQSIELLKKVFLKANQRFLSHESDSILNNLSERALCARMMLYLIYELDKTPFRKYYVDVEYNRNKGKLKTILDGKENVVPITCDLIVHSRGQILEQDNLLAIEMKKSTARQVQKDKDRDRLIILTKDSFDEVWSFDGRALPEHVCRYMLGVYYELNIASKLVLIEFYKKGEFWFSIEEKI